MKQYKETDITEKYLVGISTILTKLILSKFLQARDSLYN